MSRAGRRLGRAEGGVPHRVLGEEPTGFWLGASDVAVFAAFRRHSERPEVRIEKRPALRLKQGAFALIGEHGAVLKRGQELNNVLAPLERRLMRLID